MAFSAQIKKATPARLESMSPLRLIWYGRSLNALFLVNKELSELTSVHLFSVSLLRRGQREGRS